MKYWPPSMRVMNASSSPVQLYSLTGYKNTHSVCHTSDISLFQVGEVGEPKSFLVEITWGESYPDELPRINLDAFFNNHL